MTGLAGPVDPFWGTLAEEERAVLRAAGHARSYPRGAAVFREGDRSDFVVVILEGRVKTVVTAVDGTETLLSVRGAGAIVGELAAIDGGPRLATATALDTLRTRVLTAAEFLDFVSSRPRLVRVLLRLLVARLREADRRRIEFGAYDITSRVAHLLCELADGNGVDATGSVTVRLSQEELAAMIGASRESVTRALGELRERSIVRTGRRAVTIVDIAALGRVQ